jgi:hypothetical protein
VAPGCGCESGTRRRVRFLAGQATAQISTGRSRCGRRANFKRRSFDWRSGSRTECPGSPNTEQRARQPRGSHEHFHYRRRFPNELAHAPQLRKGCACIPPMLQRILIATGSARAWRATVHPTPCFSPHRRGHARFARARSSAAARARKHRANITMMTFFLRHIRAQLFFHRPKSLALLLAASPQRLALPQARPGHSG